MRRITKFICTRAFVTGLLIFLQAAFMAVMLRFIMLSFPPALTFFRILSLYVVFLIINRSIEPSIKLTWCVMILFFPAFGGLAYLLFGTGRIEQRLHKKLQRLKTGQSFSLSSEPSLLKKMQKKDANISAQIKYLQDICDMPAFTNTHTHYLPTGEAAFEEIKKVLLSAEKFIFIEFFIIAKGKMWNDILEILKKKARGGIDVRVLYDDMGCLATLPFGYKKELEKTGIKCAVFNPFYPALTAAMNNRDHRKIIVVDNRTAFTGGINLADEYINKLKKHGHWKDSAILLHGNAAASFTVMFLQLWNYSRPTDESFNLFLKAKSEIRREQCGGIVQPYCDSPLDSESVGENVYLNIINKARRFVYITTPYLITDSDVIGMLCLAAKNGVDVRIITPKIYDSRCVQIITQSFFADLTAAGVKIYTYTPGFIHSKTFIADDSVATVGSVNLDYRSLYHHFECGVWMYKTPAVTEIKKDFLNTPEVCEEISAQDCRKQKLPRRLMRSILKLFAPLM